MRRIVAGSLYVLVVVVLAAVAAWPIYRSGAFLVLVVCSVVLAAGIAAVVARRRGGAGWAAGLLAAAVLIAGIPLAVPARVASGVTADAVVGGLGDLAAGLVVGWKDLLTVDLPVGAYRNLLVPALVVFLVGTTVALLLAWRADRAGGWAVAVAIAMTGFGLLFGRTEVSAPLTLGPIVLPAPVETTVGLGTLGAGVLWLAWRTRDARAIRLRAAAQASGLRPDRRRGTGAGRAGLAIGMIAVAVVTAIAVAPAAVSAPRTVLREATGPRVEISRSVSPLSAYRAAFSDAAYHRELFQVSGAHVPDRIRLAVLDTYDGAVYRTGSDSSRFVRMAASRPTGPGAPVDAEIRVEGLEGIWMPSAGSLSEVRFTGPRASALADGFYVDDALAAAVQTSPWRSGDAYRIVGAVPSEEPLQDATAPGAASGGGPPAPASLRTWVQAHATGSGGGALAGLVALLRERGFLSHALTDAQTAWMADAGVTSFAPSPAGHSLARIDRLFTAVLDREQDPRAQASGNLVAAIGDDEQFAVAVALIARELGFPARVVVGARTASSDPSVAVCRDGACRADDLSAWVEVQSASGSWIPVDVTPQHAQAPSRDVTAQPDPTVGTEVRPGAVDEVDPPRPAQEDAAPAPDRAEPVDLGWLWTTLRVTGVVLAAALLLGGPFLLVLGAKAIRGGRRRGAAGARDRVAGAWDEYVDAATDAGRTPPVRATRAEIAAAMATPAAAHLAAGADAAVFSATAATDADADAFWEIVDAERRILAPTRWRRVRAAVSLRSFVPGSRHRLPSRTERGSGAD